MATDPLDEALLSARKLLVHLERHLDRAASERDEVEVGRAWVRAAQLERVLRSVLPAEATDAPEIVEALSAADERLAARPKGGGEGGASPPAA